MSLDEESVTGNPAALLPLAVVRGSALMDCPADLYIPPDALEVFLEAFEGPLDLLLYLIRRQNFDILDIPIAAITKQYISYIDLMTDMRMELAAEYLLMAAILAEIKSRMLLPRPAAAEEEETDPRADLVRRLQEYERFKAAAESLDQLPRCEREIFELGGVDTSTVTVRKVYPEVDLQEVLAAFREVLRRVERTTHHRILREPLSVRERMASVLAQLQLHPLVAFQRLFIQQEGRSGAVVSLLAILELSKERLIEIIQEEPLGPLQVKPMIAVND